MSILKCTTLSKQDGSASVPVDTVVNGSAKAWVNFNGTGTIAIRASFNVSSITDNGVGDYTVNFTNSLPDANYVSAGTTGSASASTTFLSPSSRTAANFRTLCWAYNLSGTFDSPDVVLAIFR